MLSFVQMENNKILSSSERRTPRVKHAGLTKYLRRHSVSKNSANILQDMLYRCDVSPYLGELPPELRARVSRDALGDVTYKFRQRLEDFLIDKNYRFLQVDTDTFYELPQLGDLFNTPCVLESRGPLAGAGRPWQGGVGLVCKLSFPEINAQYALKLYYDDRVWDLYRGGHGPWFEISTAFLASHAEPRDNNKIYMASLIYEKYMLCAWGGDVVDNIPKRENQNEIFFTTKDEDVNRNRRGGRRIDWGETFRTSYGTMSYRARKLYRQIINFDLAAAQRTLAQTKNNFDADDTERAMGLLSLIATYDDDKALANFIDKIYPHQR